MEKADTVGRARCETLGRSIQALECIRDVFDQIPCLFITSGEAGMPLRDLQILSEALGSKPVAIDAGTMSLAVSTRLFWTNFVLGETAGVSYWCE